MIINGSFAALPYEISWLICLDLLPHERKVVECVCRYFRDILRMDGFILMTHNESEDNKWIETAKRGLCARIRVGQRECLPVNPGLTKEIREHLYSIPRMIRSSRTLTAFLCDFYDRTEKNSLNYRSLYAYQNRELLHVDSIPRLPTEYDLRIVDNKLLWMSLNSVSRYSIEKGEAISADKSSPLNLHSNISKKGEIAFVEGGFCIYNSIDNTSSNINTKNILINLSIRQTFIENEYYILLCSDNVQQAVVLVFSSESAELLHTVNLSQKYDERNYSKIGGGKFAYFSVSLGSNNHSIEFIDLKLGKHFSVSWNKPLKKENGYYLKREIFINFGKTNIDIYRFATGMFQTIEGNFFGPSSSGKIISKNTLVAVRNEITIRAEIKIALFDLLNGVCISECNLPISNFQAQNYLSDRATYPSHPFRPFPLHLKITTTPTASLSAFTSSGDFIQYNFAEPPPTQNEGEPPKKKQRNH